ncbi:hypothetical protein SEA_CAIN_97 [Mycobacterium phage Cain]|uniref:Uncharacterized protein n=2 Tax=Unicornvirus TaxID=2948939 RepID=A0A6G6XRY5_9CAUD|nr:hypothetical protein I5G79_gp09 [Mycobacterium phage Bryler]YP_009951663.1 hypothetical protein I5G82_gp011 [Mycobacterium phage Ximenita]ASR85496.1 hypothetical protein SEA_CAIN_97 [Mycobacterium phage Cain]QGH80464.1 hypothetical protein SEA_BRYLER_89 [Mycobacterium phage Bryler]QIG61604.1 hypothetical protein SEA_XIMENITA_96 [Mycobacterium phage Ximenita]
MTTTTNIHEAATIDEFKAYVVETADSVHVFDNYDEARAWNRQNVGSSMWTAYGAEALALS